MNSPPARGGVPAQAGGVVGARSDHATTPRLPRLEGAICVFSHPPRPSQLAASSWALAGSDTWSSKPRLTLKKEGSKTGPLILLRAPRQQGFTLLEMLVVLILAGMITGILMQGLQQVFRLQAHFGRELFNTQQGEMYTEWFRQSVNGLMPDYDDGKHKFKGSEREFSGMTIAPLNTATEALLPFTWRLRFDPNSGRTQLQYGPDDDAPAVLAWPGNSGRFVYFDGNDAPHDAWPPMLGKWPQLPKAIFLESRNPEEPRIVVAVPKGLENPLPRQKDWLNF